MGAAVASAWWSITVWPPRTEAGDQPLMVIPVLATLALLLVSAWAIVTHWHDK